MSLRSIARRQPHKANQYIDEYIKALLYGGNTNLTPPYLRYDIVPEYYDAIDTITCNMSYAFWNKEFYSGQRQGIYDSQWYEQLSERGTAYAQDAYSNSFVPVTQDKALLVRHIRQGGAWTVGEFTGNARRKNTFIQSRLIALDCDDNVSVDDMLGHALIKAYAMFIYPSPSSTPKHPKTRCIFLLETPLTNVTDYEIAVRAMLDFFAEFKPDAHTKDAARLFYGSTVGYGHYNVDGILPDVVLDSIVERYQNIVAYEQEQREKARDTRPVVPITQDNAGQAAKYANVAIESELRKLAMSGSGERNNTLFQVACNLFSMANGRGWGLSHADVEHLLSSRAPRGYDFSEVEIMRTIESAKRSAGSRDLVLRG